jgi:sugar phosphate isomerase/epimerase
LALAPISQMPADEQDRVVAQLQDSPLAITCGMIGFAGENYATRETIHATGGLVPDADFKTRYDLAIACGRLGRRLGLTQISTHVGFIPEPSDTAAFEKIRKRLCQLADDYAEFGLALIFETGQETAATLEDFLEAMDRKNVGVNFDPANMLLYGKGDPVAAVYTLAPYIRHVHAKDAKLTVPEPVDAAAWRGNETPLGTGDANLPGVIRALKDIGYQGPLIIEREAGEDRHADIETAIAFLRKHV